MDSRDLMELTLETCPQAEFIPAHIWTPHFSMFGAFSDFNTIEECFGDMTPYIHAVETGLSSDPPMNWRVSQLDKLTLVSHSDAHSPQKLGREANILDTPLTYTGMVEAIRTRQGFFGNGGIFPRRGQIPPGRPPQLRGMLNPCPNRRAGGHLPGLPPQAYHWGGTPRGAAGRPAAGLSPRERSAL